MASGLQCDLMVFGPKQWVFTDAHILFEYYCVWIKYDEIKHALYWIFVGFAQKQTCRATSIAWFTHKWLLWTGSFKWIIHIINTHPSDVPPSLSFPSFPSLKGWKRGHSMAQTKRSVFVNLSILFTLIIVTLIIQSDEILRLLSGQRFRPEHLFWVFGLKRNR